MRMFRSQRDLDRSSNKVLGRFFATMFVLTLAYGFVVAVHYLLGWW